MASVFTAVGVGAPAARTLGGPATRTARPVLATTPAMAYGGRGFPSADAQREAWRRRNAARAGAGGPPPPPQQQCAPGRAPTQEELMAAMSGMAADFVRTYGAFGRPPMDGRCGPAGRQQQQQQQAQQAQRRAPSSPSPQQARVDWVPLAERAETATMYVWRLEVPGVTKGHVKTELKGADRVIVISGEKARPSAAAAAVAGGVAAAAESEEARTVRGELTYGTFARTLRMPADADLDATDQIRAAVKEGVLTLTVAKVKAAPEPEAEPPVEIPIM